METALSTLPSWIPLLTAGLFGLIVGSFFNVVIYRMPLGKSVVWPPSSCTRCGYRIPFYENIPVLSWVILRGKCKSCGDSISVQYPLIEAFTGMVAVLTAYYLLGAGEGQPLDYKIAFAYLVLTSIPIFVIDFRHFLIPDVLTYPGILLGLGLSFIPGGLTPQQSLLGAGGAALFLWLIGFAASVLMKKEAMGLGDVKLVAMAGAMFGLQTALFGLIFASFLGCLVGIPLLAWKRLDEHHHIPFGPYICVGTLLSALFGRQFLDWYLGFLNG
jgi:leader peptidase (prepilin peptidase)/N-methyltransferase